jgi:L-serine dehydratase
MNPPSIFNDIIGPIMRGPSSSHCAAAVRIGRIARDLMDGDLQKVRIDIDENGALATTHTEQGTDMGLFAGLLGWEATDERLPRSDAAIREAGIETTFILGNFGFDHPGAFRLLLENRRERHEMTVVSTGGGMISVTDLDRIPVSMTGDCCEVLIFCDSRGDEVKAHLSGKINAADEILLHQGADFQLVEVKTRDFPVEDHASDLCSRFPVRAIRKLSPVLPVPSCRGAQVPFLTASELLSYNEGKNLDLWELAVSYEMARGKLSHDEVFQKMKDLVLIMSESALTGIRGTEYEDRILGPQAVAFNKSMQGRHLLEAGVLNQMILYVTALMDMKSSLGVIVAAPTAGSCGGLPGAVLGAANALELSTDDMTRAMLAAGLIGIFISHRSTFAAEVGGCQAEAGAGSGMAAAALVTLAKGNLAQALAASSMAIQNVLGMICDPVANRVEVPCLGKNVMAASNALACANMALAGFEEVVPLDEVIEVMDEVGRSIPAPLRCTALGGLSITRTSMKITRQLKEKKQH